MKVHLYAYIYGFCLLLVCSCQHRQSYPPQFLVADSLASVQPDSALALLESLKADSLQWDKATQMYHALLTVKAHDKAYIPQTSDSLMLSVLHYYEHGGDRRLLPEAYYYMGSTYRDLGDAPRALENYQKAIDVMPGNRSLKVKSKVYAQMGELFTYQNLYDLAIGKYKLSYQIDVLLNDTVGMLYNLRDIAVANWGRNDIDSALSYFDKAMPLASDYQSLEYKNLISSQLAALHVQLGNYEYAKSLIMPSLKHFQNTNGVSVLAIAGEVYYKIGMLDSAFYYYNRLAEYDNMYAQRTANEYLSRIAEERGNTKDALAYLDNYQFWNDSVRNVESTEVVARMNALYNYQKALEEREAIIEQNNTNRWIIFLLCLLFAISILFVWFYYRRNKLRRVAMKDKLEEVEQEREMLRIENECSIAEMRTQIEDLENQLDIIGKENTQLLSTIATQQRMIQSQLLEAEGKLIRNNNLDEQLKRSKLYAHIINLINRKNKKLSGKDYEELKKLYEEVAPDFMEKLMGLCKFNDIELQVTLLRRMGISPTDIAFLTNYVKSKISNVRSDLFKRVTGEKGRASQWDEYVYNL